MTFAERMCAWVAEYVSVLVPEMRVTVGTANIYPVLGECSPSWDYIGGSIMFHDFERWPVPNANVDHEETAAHEVGHLVTACLFSEPGTYLRSAEEHIVERFARGMVALRRGMKGAPAKLYRAMGALVMSQARQRTSRAAAQGRRRMDPELAKLILSLGAMLETEQVSGELRSAIEALVAKASGGDAEVPAEAASEGEAPMAVDPEKDPNAPAAFRKALAKEEKDRLEAAKRARVATERTATLAEDGLRRAMFTAHPAIFTAEVQADCAGAAPAELDRILKIAQRLRPAAPPAPAGRQRVAPGEPREPLPDGAAPRRPNNAGFSDMES